MAQERNNTVDMAVELIYQLDEPEKPVIPQFIANWIEEEKTMVFDKDKKNPERIFMFLGRKLYYMAVERADIKDWVFGGNEEKLYQALKYGYEVEKEKLYRIKFSDNQYASRLNNRKINSILTDEELAAQYTESEIKAIDKRFWSFAEEVKE